MTEPMLDRGAIRFPEGPREMRPRGTLRPRPEDVRQHQR